MADRVLRAENAADLFGRPPQAQMPEPKPEAEQKPAELEHATDASGLPPGLGKIDLEQEQRDQGKRKAEDRSLAAERKQIEAQADALLDALAAARRRQAARSAPPQERALLEDVARFQAEGKIETAALAAAELKTVRQAGSWRGQLQTKR